MEESLFMEMGWLIGKATKMLSISVKPRVKCKYSFHGLTDISEIFT